MAAATEAGSLLEFDPNWCLFWGQAVTGFHLDIWIPYLRASRYRYTIMAGQDHFSEGVRERVAALPNVRIVEPFEEARTWLKAAPNFKGFLYIGTKQENFRMVNSFGGKLHIWLGHGESDKIYNAFRTASLYDSMFVARYGVVKRYPRAVRRWVAAGACAIGTPIVDGLVKDPWDRPRPIRTILYAPTWEGGSVKADYTSLPWSVPALARGPARPHGAGISVIMRPHPTTGRRRTELVELRDALYRGRGPSRRPQGRRLRRGRPDDQRHLGRDRGVPVHREADDHAGLGEPRRDRQDRRPPCGRVPVDVPLAPRGPRGSSSGSMRWRPTTRCDPGGRPPRATCSAGIARSSRPCSPSTRRCRPCAGARPACRCASSTRRSGSWRACARGIRPPDRGDRSGPDAPRSRPARHVRGDRRRTGAQPRPPDQEPDDQRRLSTVENT